MKKIGTNLKKSIIAGKKITNGMMHQGIMNFQMYGNALNNVLGLINEIIYYANPKNVNKTPTNFHGPTTFIKALSNSYTSSINFGSILF